MAIRLRNTFHLNNSRYWDIALFPKLTAALVKFVLEPYTIPGWSMSGLVWRGTVGEEYCFSENRGNLKYIASNRHRRHVVGLTRYIQPFIRHKMSVLHWRNSSTYSMNITKAM